MRRNRKVDPKDYIQIRITQLKEERKKSEDRMTQMWIYKIKATKVQNNSRTIMAKLGVKTNQ